VFYVEQVALNRHVPSPRNKEQLTKPQSISALVRPSSGTFPTRQPRHFTLRKGRFRSTRRIVVLPPITAIGDKNIVEQHLAQPQQDKLPDIANIERSEEAVRFQKFPMHAIFITERGHLLAQNVA